MHESERPTEQFDLSFGEELRREREIRGISLKEIADATKISKRFLEAIEKNDYKTLPAPVFTRGFIREYARYLGLNADDMVNRYMHFARSTGEAAPILDAPLPKPQKKKGIPRPYALIDRNVIIAVIFLVALIALGWWARTAMIERPSEPVPVVSAPTETVSSAARSTTSASLAESAVTTAELTLTVRTIANTWIELEADGKRVLVGEMNSGDEQTFTAKEAFLLKTVGNAAGVELMLNRRRLPPLGEEGEVVKNRSLDRDLLATLPGTASPERR